MASDDSVEKSENWNRWLDGTVPPAIGTGSALLAASIGADAPTAAAAGLVVNRGIALVIPGVRRRLESFLSAIRRPWEGVADPEAEFWKRVKERESAQEVWFVAADRLRGLVDPTVAAVLGALVREHVEQDKMPDEFFRDLSGLLVEIRADELAELRRLFVTIASLGVRSPRVRAEMHPSDGAAVHLRFHTIGEGEAQRSFTSLLGTRFECVPATQRVLRLLGRHGLADGGAESSSGLVYVHVRMTVVERLLLLMVDV